MDSMSDSISDAKNDAPGSDGKLNRTDYKREIARRHVEFVKLEQWVVHKGLNAARLSAALSVYVPRWPT
jgi:polyphosphate kinase